MRLVIDIPVIQLFVGGLERFAQVLGFEVAIDESAIGPLAMRKKARLPPGTEDLETRIDVGEREWTDSYFLPTLRVEKARQVRPRSQPPATVASLARTKPR